MKAKENAVDEILKNQGYDFKWISGDDVVVSQWVRMKCTYGCPDYGAKATCPPHVPSIAECREFIKEYKKIAVIHIPTLIVDPDKRREWTKKCNADLVKLERSIFLAGNHKAFLLTMGSCYICSECAGSRVNCIDKGASRPTPEAFGVDVFATVRKCGYPIDVLEDFNRIQNRYAFLLVE